MTTRDKLAFALELGRRTRATVRQCEALLRYAGTLTHLAEVERMRELNMTEVRKRVRIQRTVTELCREITGFTGKYSDTCTCGGERVMHGRLDHPFTPVWESGTCEAMFTGATLKIRVPDGGEVVVPS